MDAFAATLSRKNGRDILPTRSSALLDVGVWRPLTASRPLEIPVIHTFHPAPGSVKRRHLGERDPSPTVRIDAELARRVGRLDAVLATTVEEVEELEHSARNCGESVSFLAKFDTTLFTPVARAETRGARWRLVVVSRLVEAQGVDD